MKFSHSPANDFKDIIKINLVSYPYSYNSSEIKIYISGKLIKLIISNFIPRCSGGPGARLRLLLEGAIQNGFKDPPGAIGQGFWGTRDMYTGKVAGD